MLELTYTSSLTSASAKDLCREIEARLEALGGHPAATDPLGSPEGLEPMLPAVQEQMERLLALCRDQGRGEWHEPDGLSWEWLEALKAFQCESADSTEGEQLPSLEKLLTSDLADSSSWLTPTAASLLATKVRRCQEALSKGEASSSEVLPHLYRCANLTVACRTEIALAESLEKLTVDRKPQRPRSASRAKILRKDLYRLLMKDDLREVNVGLKKLLQDASEVREAVTNARTARTAKQGDAFP